MLAVLKIRHRKPQKPRLAFTLQPRGRFAFTWPKQRALRALTLSPTLRGRSTLRSRRAVSSRRNRSQAEAFSGGGFTLLELLAVMAIFSILLVAIVPAFTTIKSSGDVTSAADTISDTLQQARTYAIANSTYVWVGFYEENTTATAATNATPAYPGKGRLLIAAVSSRDGTKIFEDSDPIAALPTTRISPLGKLIKIEGVHIADIGPPAGGNSDTLDGRPDWPYTDGLPLDHFNRISSDSSDTTTFNFTTQNYTFYKTVRFSPRGEANLNSTYSLKTVAEIGIRPTHGNTVDLNSRNVVAIQFGGIGGNFKIYRR